MSDSESSDIQELKVLNARYIDCVVHADADQFAKILAEDFLNSGPDGSITNKAEFLRKIGGGKRLQFMNIEDVRIRLFGDIAIIHGRTVYASAEGVPGSGRYTDIWAKRQGQWLAVAAHVTRLDPA